MGTPLYVYSANAIRDRFRELDEALAPVPHLIAYSVKANGNLAVVRTLAEPNLTAISGESATFIAGGEFPIPAGYACDPVTHVCTTQISFKKFGISLNFTPVVLTEGRISLRFNAYPDSVQALGDLRRWVEARGGAVTVERMPPAWLGTVDPWGLPRADAPMARAIKATFDPDGVFPALAPGLSTH